MLTEVNILAGKSRYDIFSLWQRALCDAFQRLGIRAQVVELRRDEQCPARPGLISVSFNLVRTWSLRQPPKPHLAWMVDHPAFHAMLFDNLHHRPRLPADFDRCLVGNVDARWVEFIKSFYAFPAAHFLPHAGLAARVAPDDWARREFDVVFFGSVESPSARRAAILDQAASLRPLFEVVLERYKIESGRSLDEVFLQMLTDCKLPPEVVRAAFNRYLAMLTGYFLHAGHRVRLLRAVRRHKVHVFGAGPWDELDLPDNIIKHGPVGYAETLEILRRARILLNHSPLMPWGGHERIFDGLLCGCGIVTGPSSFIRAEFGGQAGVVFYSNDGLNEVDRVIDDLQNDADAPTRISASSEIVAGKHMMFNRAGAIRDLAQARWPDL